MFRKRSILQQLAVGVTHPAESIVRVGGIPRGQLKGCEGASEAPFDRSHEELLLGAEEPEQIGL